MIMVPPLIQFKNCPVTFEIMPIDQTDIRKLRQHAVDGCQTYHLARFNELKINILGTQMVVRTFFQYP